MAEPYNLRTFIWKSSLPYLEELLRRHAVRHDVWFTAPEADVRSVVFRLVADLPLDDRDTLERDFQDIFGLASQRGVEVALRVASRRGELKGTVEEHRMFLAGLRNDVDRSFWLFLHCPKTWAEALQLVEVEGIANAYWHKHPRIPKARPDFSRQALDKLGAALGEYFHVMEGHGRSCQIDLLQSESITYLLCFLEDKSRAEPSWDGPVVVRRPSRRAVPLVFAYSEKKHKLDTHIRGRPRSVHACQSLFGEHILGLRKLDPAPRDRSVYDLESFKHRGVQYRHDRATGLDTIAVRRLRLTPRLGKKRHIVLDANPTGLDEPVYDILENELKEVDLAGYEVTQVELKAVFRAVPGHRRQTIPFALTKPNRCSLRYDGRHLVLRQVLEETGIEPK